MVRRYSTIAPLLLSCSCAASPQIEFFNMGGIDNFAMLAPLDIAADDLVVAAKEKCGRAQICFVFGWGKRGDLARALPLTDQEVTTMTFQFKLNRNTGYEESLWNCEIYKAKQADSCLDNRP